MDNALVNGHGPSKRLLRKELLNETTNNTITQRHINYLLPLGP